MSKKIKNLFKKVAPVALPILGSMIPGVGTALGAALGGAAGGLVSGGGLKGALTGGLTSGLSSGLSGALAGGLSKGAMGLASQGSLLPISASSAGGGLLSGMGGLGSAYSKVSPIVSGAIDIYSQDKAADELEQQQRQALGYITPLMEETFTPGDLENTPGYQFNLGQGQKAIDRAAAARGNYFSGQALTDASDYAQGLAQNTYQDAYSNWLNDRSQRLGAAGAAAGIQQGIGETQATKTLNIGQTAGQSASALLGALSGGNIYNPRTGTYYDPSSQYKGISTEEIMRMLGRG